MAALRLVLQKASAPASLGMHDIMWGTETVCRFWLVRSLLHRLAGELRTTRVLVSQEENVSVLFIPCYAEAQRRVATCLRVWIRNQIPGDPCI